MPEKRLENALCAVALSDQGCITSIKNKRTGTEFVTARPALGWKAITTLGSWVEHPVFDRDNRGRIELAPGRVQTTFDELLGAEGVRLPIRLVFTYELSGDTDEIIATYTVSNLSDETVNEIWFPFLSGLNRIGGDQRDYLAFPCLVGRRLEEPAANLPLRFVPCHAGRSGDCGIGYPGFGSMGWMEFYTAGEGLYLGNHNPAVPRMTHLARRRADGGFEIGFATYPFVGPGQTYASPPFLISPHVGDWHVGARKYRAYMEGWMPTVEKPAWLAGAPGIRIVFMKHQTGRIYLRYPDLVAIWRELRDAGLADVPLVVWAWFRSGHDSGYPAYEPDPEMGGREALVEALRTIREEGGRTILYTNGVLIDRSGPYYQRGPGRGVAMKNRDGHPYFDEYSYCEEGTIHPNKTFAIGCPSAARWEAQLDQLMDEVMDLGASGVLYDQLGGYLAHLCFDKTHGHTSPALACSAKVGLLQRLKARAEERDPDFGIMTEIHTDAFTQLVDLIHAAPYGPEVGSESASFLEMYRYAFPEQHCTSRASWEIETINYAFVMGLAFEYAGRHGPTLRLLERKQGHSFGPEIVGRIERMMRLRSRLRPYLIDGRFADTDGLCVFPAAAVVKVFVAADGEERALAAWNREARAARVSVEVKRTSPAWQLYRLDGSVAERESPPGEPVEFDLDPGGVAVAVIR